MNWQRTVCDLVRLLVVESRAMRYILCGSSPKIHSTGSREIWPTHEATLVTLLSSFERKGCVSTVRELHDTDILPFATYFGDRFHMSQLVVLLLLSVCHGVGPMPQQLIGVLSRQSSQQKN